MEAFVIFPALCIFLSVFAWVVTFVQPHRAGRALGISLLFTAPFVAVGILFAKQLITFLFMAGFALGPLAAMFITYALFRKRGYTHTRHAWLKALGLFLLCALGVLAIGYACLFIALAHYPAPVTTY